MRVFVRECGGFTWWMGSRLIEWSGDVVECGVCCVVFAMACQHRRSVFSGV